MRIVVIGGTGHVGSYLVPRLVRGGHQVLSLSRGNRQPYVEDRAWDEVTQITVDRDAEDAAGTFGSLVSELDPDVVIDMLCFTLDSAASLVAGIRGRVDHLIHCGSIWMHGPSAKIPITEENGSPPLGEYGIQKAAIARMLTEETTNGGLVTTSLHPGHISGPGWAVINPVGNLDPTVWERLAGGAELNIPGLGAELMHHVHADDVAQAFVLAVEHRDPAAGQAFNVTAPSALTVRGFAEIAAGWFGREALLNSVSWEEFRAQTGDENADTSWAHLSRSQCMSIDKARRRLDYQPAYEPEAAAKEAVRWLIEHNKLNVDTPIQA
ncbi:MAG: NAD-dependent epimerase/dehydratase family protein [Propionibacteriaceae bacterium]|nr:NAD-dependent epimerase/dehydratase family protein [Propionibacteriaceae bacterium]